MTLTELHHLLNNNLLKLARLSLMQDRNEGLGAVLGFLESFEYSYRLISSQKEIINHHKSIMARNYISSWTEEPDLMAMWLLYSKNKDSIRVKTSLEKLKIAINNYAEENFFFMHLDSPKGTLQVDSSPHIKPVEYACFELLSEGIKDRYRKYLETCSKYHASPLFIDKLNELEETRLISPLNSKFIKDKSYSHEKEIRANISICTKNSLTREEVERQWEQEDESISSLLGTITCDYPPSHELPDVISIPILSDFIEAICFDPRAPEHIRKEQKAILNHVNPNIKIEESKIFGYKPNHHIFSIDD